MEIIPINLRLIHMKIQAKNAIENYIQCYGPLNTDEEDFKDEFFENLHDTYQTPSSNIKTHMPTHGINGATKEFVHRLTTS